MSSSFESVSGIRSLLGSIPKFSSSGISATNFDLGRMKGFCREMGDPQDRFRTVHVAGTNGKGTTCQMLASVYQHAGYRCGLYTSPHLMDVKERFRINGKEISDEDLMRFFRLYGQAAMEKKLTFFELTTALAFWHFSEKNVDLAVIETGLGGRLDATNIITPEVSVITSVGPDHSEILGNTLSLIAREKAGIIKQGRPVVIGDLPADAVRVIQEVSRKRGSELSSFSLCKPGIKGGAFHLQTRSGQVLLNGKGRKKIDSVNCAVTYLAVETMQQNLPVNVMEFRRGIEQVDSIYPNHAHFEKLSPEHQWYFDGAHNPESANILTGELLQLGEHKEWTVVLSFMKEKLNEAVAAPWSDFPNIFLFEQQTERAAAFSEMKKYFPSAERWLPQNEPLRRGANEFKTELVIFSGSFYFYEKVRRWMGTIANNNE